MFAFHVDVPSGVNSLDLSYDYVSPADSNSSREAPSSTAKLAVLNWYMVTLYPLGQEPADLIYVATLRLPQGWKYGTALPVAKESAGFIEFAPAPLATVIDSPVLAGLYLRHIDLSPGQTPAHTVHVAAEALRPSKQLPRKSSISGNWSRKPACSSAPGTIAVTISCSPSAIACRLMASSITNPATIAPKRTTSSIQPYLNLPTFCRTNSHIPGTANIAGQSVLLRPITKRQ